MCVCVCAHLSWSYHVTRRARHTAAIWWQRIATAGANRRQSWHASRRRTDHSCDAAIWWMRHDNFAAAARHSFPSRPAVHYVTGCRCRWSFALIAITSRVLVLANFHHRLLCLLSILYTALTLLQNYATKNNKNVSGDWPVSTHADPTSTCRTIFHERRISSMTFTSAHLYANVYMCVGVARALADSFEFWFLREQSLQKSEIPCLGCRWTVEQNLTPLSLSWAAKSVNVQTHKITKNSNQYIQTQPIYPHLLIGTCG